MLALPIGSNIHNDMPRFVLLAAGILAALTHATPLHAQWPATEGDVDLPGFRFENGQALPNLRIHYRTLGTPQRDARGEIYNAVLILHSSGSNGAQFLRPAFAGELFGPGQPLDARRYFLIMPDAIGHGGSSKPSDGLRARFPNFSYGDMVVAQREALVRGLGVRHLRLVIGTSLGCGHTFLWATRFPQASDAWLPLACLPAEIGGQNRVWRRAAIEAIRTDPEWRGGDYAAQPRQGMRAAISLQMIAAGIGPWAMARDHPTRAAADAYFEQRFAREMAALDANDLIYQLEASARYDPSGDLDRVTAPMTWISFADDTINLPGSRRVADLAARIPGARYALIPASEETRGHSTHSLPRFWKEDLVALLARSEPEKAAR